MSFAYRIRLKQGARLLVLFPLLACLLGGCVASRIDFQQSADIIPPAKPVLPLLPDADIHAADRSFYDSLQNSKAFSLLSNNGDFSDVDVTITTVNEGGTSLGLALASIIISGCTVFIIPAYSESKIEYRYVVTVKNRPFKTYSYHAETDTYLWLGAFMITAGSEHWKDNIGKDGINQSIDGFVQDFSKDVPAVKALL